MASLRLLPACLAAALAMAVAPAGAATVRIAEVGETSGLAAWHGRVVFNRLVAGSPAGPDQRWQLTEATQDGIAPLDVPVLPRPVSIDVGPDAEGRPVAVYSRCVGTGYGICHVYELALWRRGAAPRLVRPLWRKRYSDTAPSVWRGRIAFGRTLTGVDRTHIAAMFVQRSPGSRELVRIARGTVPGCPAHVQDPCARYAGPARSDLGPRALAMTWYLSGGNAIPQDAEELWRIPLDGGTGALLDSAVMAECGFGNDISFVAFLSPSLSGPSVDYLELAGDCWATQSRFVRTGPSWRTQRRHEVGGMRLAYDMARDGGRIWWIRGPSYGAPSDGGSATEPCTETPCQLMLSTGLRFRPTRVPRRPRPPVDPSLRR